MFDWRSFGKNDMNHVITLLTDFGTRDSYVAQMKAVLLSRVRDGQIVDITHEVPPQDVVTGARILREVFPYFAPRTVHVVVVDPGVGTDRRIVAVEIEQQYLVLPDNGLLQFLSRDFSIRQAVAVENPAFWRQPVSSTFHGRDIMAPVAASLCQGVLLGELGPAIFDLGPKAERARPELEEAHGRISVQVLAVDHFGNVLLDLPGDFSLTDWALLSAEENGNRESVKVKFVSTYGQGKVGELVGLVGSGNYWELAVVNGSAAALLGIEKDRRLWFHRQ